MRAGDLAVRTAIQHVAARFTRYGYGQLKRKHYDVVNSAWQVRVLMADMGLKGQKNHDAYNQIGPCSSSKRLSPRRIGVLVVSLLTKDSAPLAAELGR